MEPIKQLLKQACPQSQSTTDFSFDIDAAIAELPGLATFPREVLERSKHTLQILLDQQRQCASCKKDGADYSCSRLVAQEYRGELQLAAGPCPRQVHYQQQRKINQLFGESMLGRRWMDCSLQTYQVTPGTKDAHRYCTEYVTTFNSNTQNGIYIYGDFGLGKTHLAVSVIRALIEKQFCCMIINVPNFLQRLRASIKKEDSSLEQIMKALYSSQLLVLDDLGAERHTEGEWAAEQIYMIINARYDNLQPVIITSNKRPDELIPTLGERTVSRIIESTHGIKVSGANWRERKLVAAK